MAPETPVTGRERVRRALEFDTPDRVPRDLWHLPIAWIEHGIETRDRFLARWPGDITQAPNFGQRPSPVVRGNPAEAGDYVDEWGCTFHTIKAGVNGEVKTPLYREYAEIARHAGKKLLMHSDGHIFEIYEDLVEIGVDAINSQLFCMDIEEIGRRFAGRMSFWGETDRQHVLPHGSVSDVRAAVDRVAASLYRPAGGVIAQFSWEEHVPLANAEAVYERWTDIERTT